MCNKNLHECIHASITAPLRLGIFATWKSVGHGLEYGPEMSGPKKGIELSKTEITKIEENLKRNDKTLSKVKSFLPEMFYFACYLVCPL